MDQRATVDELRQLATRRLVPEAGAVTAPQNPGAADLDTGTGKRPGLLRSLLGLARKDAPRERPFSAQRRPDGDARRATSGKAGGPAPRDGAKPPGPKPGGTEARDDKSDAAPSGSGQKPSKLVYAVPAVLVAGLVAWGGWTHRGTSHQAAEAQRQAADFIPTLRTATAKRQDGPVALTLPGATAPFDAARLYARATGFVAERRVDIGSRVKKGDLLLRIAAPDLNAQLVQAAAQLGQTRAALVQAQANVVSSKSNVDLARVTNSRTSTLAAQGWETRQNADNSKAGLQSGTAGVDAAQAAVTVAESNIAAQFAAVQRLQALVGYLEVLAPFDGVVTARSVDTGDLVTADAGSGTALFALQRDDVLRVQVQVPQSGAVSLRDGLPAKVQVQELPGQDFTGTVSRNAVALDPASRTVLVEVDLPNGDGRLRPGLYVTVEFLIPRDHPGVVVPDEAVLFNGQGLRVAVVGGDGTVHMQDVTIARDFGTTVELRDGLQGGEQVALSPPVDLADKQKVKIQAPPPAEKANAPAGQQPQAK